MTLTNFRRELLIVTVRPLSHDCPKVESSGTPGSSQNHGSLKNVCNSKG